jgi:hypothetical protein
MLQNRKTTVWMLLASLIVMSIFISSFATSATRIYARQQQAPHLLDLYVIRPFSSEVGAVQAEDTTNERFSVKCLHVPNQNSPTFVNAFGLNDNVIITIYPDGNCAGAGRIVHQNSTIRDLQACSRAIKHTNACRALQLDFQA